MRHFAPFVFAAVLPLAPIAALADEVTIFAAASMKTALDQIASDWQAETGNTTVISYAGSSALAKQIIAGAPADLFISASSAWMDKVEAEGALAADTRRDLLGNTLVLIASEPGEVSPADLPAKLGDEHLAMALVDSVPAGQYGKAALIHLGLWDTLAPQVAEVDNVRAALALVATGEAPYGIVYATDAAAEPKVHIAATFPAESHPAITYPVALLKDAPAPGAAQALLDYFGTPAAAAIFEAQGFAVKGAE